MVEEEPKAFQIHNRQSVCLSSLFSYGFGFTREADADADADKNN